MLFFPVSQSVADQPPMRQHWRLRLLGFLMIPAVLIVGIGFSTVLIDQPVYGAALVVAIAGLYLFFQSFETTVVGILCLRSFLDFYSSFQVPAAFALGVDLLVLLYVARQWLERKPVHTDPFWWFLITWVLLQGIWVVLLPTTALGGTSYMAYEALREWIRFFSLAIVYLLVMQMRDRIPPQRLASLLFISLVLPMIFALLQSLPIELPSFLQSNVGWKTSWKATEERVTSTLGHYNSFATFSLLFMALSLWRVQMARKPFGWLLLVAGTMYCLIATKSLTGLVMMLVFIALYFLPKLRGKGLLGVLAISVVLFFVLTSELAQSRLVELDYTPLLNPDLSFKRAVALQAADVNGFRNSFNWRLLQWRGLLLNWQLHPWLGYGLASAKKVSEFGTTSHNDYVRFLVEEGIVGFSLFMLFLGAQVARIVQIMRRSLPGSPQHALSQTMLAFAIAMIVGMGAGNVMVHTATFFYWWVLMAILGWPSWPARFGDKPVAVAGGFSSDDGGDNGYGLTGPDNDPRTRWSPVQSFAESSSERHQPAADRLVEMSSQGTLPAFSSTARTGKGSPVASVSRVASAVHALSVEDSVIPEHESSSIPDNAFVPEVPPNVELTDTTVETVDIYASSVYDLDTVNETVAGAGYQTSDGFDSQSFDDVYVNIYASDDYDLDPSDSEVYSSDQYDLDPFDFGEDA